MKQMKAPLSLLLLLLYTYSAAAQYQPLAVENAHWRIHVDDLETPWDDLIYEYVCRGDTTVEGQAYKKVYRRDFVYEEEPFPGQYPMPYRISNSRLHGLLREDTTTGEVWAVLMSEGDFRPAGEEFLLFDFSAQPGDTLRSFTKKCEP